MSSGLLLIKRRLGSITDTMLAQSLRELEDDGMINRTEYDEKILRVEYSLTERGKRSLPMLTAATEWAIKEMGFENLEAYCSQCVTL